MKKLAMILAAIMLLSALSVTAFAADEAYYVAGVADLCGSSWKENDENNKMTLNADGLYEKVYENVPAGPYELKVTDGTWTNSWGNNGGNYSVMLSGESTVTVLFNAETKTVEVKTQLTGGGSFTFEYYVAGDANLCGVEWDPAAEANKMTKNSDGLYEKVYENVQPNSYSFKITVGSWNASWGNGSSNYVIDVLAAGTVKILFNEETKEITVELPDASGIEPNYYVAGTKDLCGTEWDPAAAANKMTKNADGLYEILYKDLKAGNYEFKVTNGSWNGCWGGNGKDGNYAFTLKTDGNVKILFNAETKAITVEGDVAPTADSSHVFAFVTLMAVSAVAMAMLVTKKRAF